MAKDCLSATADIHKKTRVSQLEEYTLIESDPREAGNTIIQRQEHSLEMVDDKKEIHQLHVIKHGGFIWQL